MSATSFPVTIRLRADGKGLEGTLKVTERESRRLQRSLDDTGRSAQRSGRQMQGAGQQVDRLGARAQSAGVRIGGMVRTLFLLAGIGSVVAGITSAGSAMADFEQNMAGVRAVTQPTEQELRQLTATARELGATTEFSAGQAAAGMRFLGQAGFDAAEQIAAIPATLDLATAASIDLAQAADITSNVLSGFRMEAAEAGRMADVLAATSASANTNVVQLGSAMAFVGPVASAMGIEVEGAAAAVGVLSDAGIQGSAAGTGLRRVLSSLANPSREAESTLRALGLTMDEVNPSTNELTDIIDSLAASGLGATEAFQIFGDRGGPALLALVAQNDRLRELTERINDSSGAAATMAGIMRDTLRGDIKQLGSAIQELILQFGDAGFQGALRGTVQMITNVVRAIPDFIRLIQILGGALAGLLVARMVGPAIAGMNTAIAAGTGIVYAKAAAVNVLRGALAALGGPVGILFMVVGALAAFGMAQHAAAAESEQLQMRVLSLTGQFEELNRAQQEHLATEIQAEMLEINRAMARTEGSIEKLQDKLAAEERWGSKGAEMTREQIGRLEEQLSSSQDRLNELAGSLGQVNDAMAGVGDESDEIQDKLKGLIEEFEALIAAAGRAADADFTAGELRASMQRQIESLIEERLELQNGTAAVLEYRIAKLVAAGASEEMIASVRETAAALLEEQSALEQVRRAQQEQKEAIRAADRARKEVQSSLEAVHSGMQRQIESLTEERLELEGGTAAVLEYRIAKMIAAGASEEMIAGVRETAAALLEEQAALAQVRKAQQEQEKATRTAARALRETENRLESLKRAIDPAYDALQQFNEGIETLQASLELGLIDEAEFDRLVAGFERAASAAALIGRELQLAGEMGAQGFRSLQQLTTQGSDAYHAMEAAIQASNIAAAIGAIMNQGMGDPYTAFARMAAMAAMVSQFVGSVGSIGGSAGSVSDQRQANQGTGTVLGDAGAKSESIVNATKITADAVRELVGINRGMLRSLQALQRAIGSASGMLARGAGDIDLSGIDLGLTGIEKLGQMADPIGFAIDSFIGGLFGFGRTKIVDQGIALLGGLITDMTEGAAAQAFGELKRKSLFGSKRATMFEDLDDAFNSQLNLIFASMIDTVEAAGVALGIPLDDLRARIESFEVQAQEISLKDLDADQQQAELEAVFSSIFDGLAGHVVPFVAQFQKLGEGLGQTLVRVATGVQVTEEAMRRLGFQAERTGPEQFAQLSERLIDFSGGLDAFIDGIGNFFDKFATDSQKFEVAQDSLTRAFEQFDIVLPSTRDGMAELMRTLDATTESGAEQIAMLLELATAADAYYRHIEQIQSEREGLEKRLLELQGDTTALRGLELEALDESNRALQLRIWALEEEQELQQLMAGIVDDIRSMAWSQLRQEMHAAAQQHLDNIQALQRLNATEEMVALERERFAMRQMAIIGMLRASIQDLADEFNGVDRSVQQSTDSMTQGVGSAVANMRDTIIRGLQAVEKWLERSLLDNVSSLTPQERIDVAGQQFRDAIAAVQAGDMSRLADLPGLADAFRREGASFFGTSTEQFRGLEAEVRAAMQAVAGLEPPPEMQQPTFAQTERIASATQGTERSALDQAMTAKRIMDELGVLVGVTGESAAEIARESGLNIGELIQAMTGELPGLTGDALAEYFDELVAETDQQLNALGRLEQSALDQITELGVVQDLLRDIRDGRTGADAETAFAAGGIVTRPTRGLVGEAGPEAIIPLDRFFNQVLPAGGSDAETQRLLAQIEQRLARIEQHAGEGNSQRGELIGVTASGLAEVVEGERRMASKLQHLTDKRPARPRGDSLGR